MTIDINTLKRSNANGFYSEENQTAAHNTIIDILRAIKPKSIIDLGCGDMALLRKLAVEFDSYVTGVDNNADNNPTVHKDIFDLEYLPRNYNVALISKARIKEEPIKWLKLILVLEKFCDNILIYSYNNDTSIVPIGQFNFKCGVRNLPYSADIFEL